MRKLQVDFAALGAALEDQTREFLDYYFDTHTGDVEEVPPELLDEIEFPGSSEFADVETWGEELLDIARTIVEESGPSVSGRYEWVPQRESREAYQTMVRFAESVESEELRRLLDVALNGRGAFRRFKDVLYDFPDERERWFAFNNAELREYATDWLRTLGIEAVPRPRPGPQQEP